MQVLALVAFLITVVLVLWRPGGIHESIPALLGAFGMFLVGLIDRHDVIRVMGVVGNSATTIIATFIMASVLEGAGFFRWATERLIENAQGSRRRLFHLCLVFMTCLTLFLNNDGSILLGMPVILGIVQRVRMPKRTAFVFLIASGLIASATSSVVGVSNMANLEAMGLVGISLLEHLREIWFPAVVGICASWYLLSRLLRDEPEQADTLVDQPPRGLWTPSTPPGDRFPPLDGPPPLRWPGPPPHHHFKRPPHPPQHDSISTHRRRTGTGLAEQEVPPLKGSWMMWTCVWLIVLVRAGFFFASIAQVPNGVVAAGGALVMLGLNAVHKVVKPRDALRQAPWAILGFAFGLDLVVFGLRNAHLTGLTAGWIGPLVRGSITGVAFLPGALVALLASSLNNHPALIVGSLTLLDITGLSKTFLNVAYAGVVLGSDLGALLTPVGTLASLLWFHILKQYGLRYSWADYLKVTLTVIPISFLLALCGLYLQALLTTR